MSEHLRKAIKCLDVLSGLDPDGLYFTDRQATLTDTATAYALVSIAKSLERMGPSVHRFRVEP